MEKRISFAVIFLLSLSCTLQECNGLTIDGNLTQEVVVVENGTVQEIILDCPYILEEQDKDGLVIKWFYKSGNIPVFQWIPNGVIKVPQLSDLDDTIDELYEHCEDPLHKYRALRLVNPDTSNTGLYTCQVSSYYDEINIPVKLVIYSLPSSISLSVEELQPGNLSVQCNSEPAFPEPDLALSMLIDGERTQLLALKDNTWSDGLYNSSVYLFLERGGLQIQDTIEFQCEFTIPLTDLSITETLTFEEFAGGGGSSGGIRSLVNSVLLLAAVIASVAWINTVH